MVQYEQQLIEVRRDVNREAVREEVEKAFGAHGKNLRKLVDDAAKALALLKEKGVVTQDELNAAVR
jgi:hypothetical protein